MNTIFVVYGANDALEDVSKTTAEGSPLEARKEEIRIEPNLNAEFCKR